MLCMAAGNAFAVEKPQKGKPGQVRREDRVASSIQRNGQEVNADMKGILQVFDNRKEEREEEEEEVFSVLVNLDYDEAEYAPDMMSMAMKPGYGSVFEIGMWDFEYPGTISFALPAGTYNLCLCFTNQKEACPVYVYKENVVVNGDVEIEASPSEADQCVVFDPRDPEGNILSTDIYVWKGDEQLELWQKGMLEYTDQLFLIKSKSCGEINGLATMRWAHWYEDDALHTNANLKVYASKSDDLFFSTVVGGVGLTQSIMCLLVSDGSHTQTVTNETNYTTITQRFASTPYTPAPDENGEIREKGQYCTMGFRLGYNDAEDWSNLYGAAGERFMQTDILAWQAPEEKRQGMTLLPVPVDWEALNSSEIENIEAGSVWALPANIETANPAYIGWVNGNFRFAVSQDGVWNFRKADNPFMAFETSENPLWGEGFPVISTSSIDESDIIWNVIGARGEDRRIDRTLLKKTVNGKEYTRNFVTPDIENGTEIRLEDSNYTIGGINGVNVTEVSLSPASELVPPPTLQMLRTVDAGGNVKTEFASSADAKAQLYCGVFHYVEPEEGYGYYNSERVNGITLEYSPYQKDSWKPIEVKADESRDFLPGWGYFYVADMSVVDRKSDNGWFDLRVILDNGEGGTVTETISPAFRVDDLSGVEAVNGDTVIYVRGNDIIAPADARIYDMAGVETYRENLAKGIYLVCVGGYTKKVIVR